jgi:glucose 1-dehydrogenase
MSFTGKTAIITGAGQGIGFEIARQLALAGASVVLNDADEKCAADAAGRMERSAPGKCTAIAGDAGDPGFVDSLVKQTIGKYGRLDIAIANAGVTLFGDFLSYPTESFERVMKVNAAGTFFLAQAAARQMKQQGDGGSLLFTSSVTGHQAHKDLAAYSMSKAAIEMLAKNLVIELSAYGININTIAPGATLTERTMDEIGYAETWSRLTPLGRAASVNDIASTALFLVSDAARHITGQTIIIDGGWTCVSPSPY